MKQGAALSLLTLCAVLVAAVAHADPRGVSSPPEALTPEQIETQRVQTAADIDTWLRRLPGKFRYGGIEEIPPLYCYFANPKLPDPYICTTPKPRDADGAWDCVGIGAGPGVHCVLGSMAQRRFPMRPNMDSPTMILLGMDPDIPGIRYMRFDSDGIASESIGYLKGDAATFRMLCVNPMTPGCYLIVKIRAPADGRPVTMSVEKELAGVGDGYEIVERLVVKLRPMAEVQAQKSESLRGTP